MTHLVAEPGLVAEAEEEGSQTRRRGYASYVGLKVLGAIGSLFFMLIVNFFLFRVLPGDPAKTLGRGRLVSQEQVDAFNKTYGLNESMPQQFVTFLKNIVHGDLGISLQYRLPVSQLIMDRMWPTILLVGTSTILATVIGVYLGIKGAWNRGGMFDKVSTGSAHESSSSVERSREHRTERTTAHMAGRIEGKVAVVTGGCSGIGLATVSRFVEEGAKVVIGDIDDERGHALVGQLGGEEIATYVHVDVTSKEEVDALFALAKSTYGSVDIAFNNAGISPPDDDSILDTDLEAWRRVQEVNLTSVYLCCKAALPYMLEQRSGSIINTASFVAVMGAATSQISYSASKGGVLSMSRELGVQFAREGVRVNALCPGPVNTPLLKELFAKDAERAARRLVHVPMGRFAEPEEMANAVLFLASDDSSFITANTFLVDGGISGAYVTPL